MYSQHDSTSSLGAEKLADGQDVGDNTYSSRLFNFVAQTSTV